MTSIGIFNLVIDYAVFGPTIPFQFGDSNILRNLKCTFYVYEKKSLCWGDLSKFDILCIFSSRLRDGDNIVGGVPLKYSVWHFAKMGNSVDGCEWLRRILIKDWTWLIFILDCQQLYLPMVKMFQLIMKLLKNSHV